MMVEAEGICLDYCRQKVTQDWAGEKGMSTSSEPRLKNQTTILLQTNSGRCEVFGRGRAIVVNPESPLCSMAFFCDRYGPIDRYIGRKTEKERGSERERETGRERERERESEKEIERERERERDRERQSEKEREREIERKKQRKKEIQNTRDILDEGPSPNWVPKDPTAAAISSKGSGGTYITLLRRL